MLKFMSLAFRIRYLLPATAVGGYYSARNKYEELKSNLPEMPDFVKNLLDKSKGSLESIDLDSWTASLNDTTQTFNDWLDEAGEALRRRRSEMTSQSATNR